MLKAALAGLVVMAVAGLLAAALTFLARAFIGIALMAFIFSFVCLLVRALSQEQDPKVSTPSRSDGTQPRG